MDERKEKKGLSDTIIAASIQARATERAAKTQAYAAVFVGILAFLAAILNLWFDADKPAKPVTEDAGAYPSTSLVEDNKSARTDAEQSISFFSEDERPVEEESVSLLSWIGEVIGYDPNGELSGVKFPLKQNKSLSVLSQEKMCNLPNKNTIQTVKFVETLSHTPESTEDFSESGDGGVLCWREGNTLILAGKGGVMAPKSCENLFGGWSALQTVNRGELLDVSNVTNMRMMFCDCQNLTTLDVSNWNTSKVTEMSEMFSNCERLGKLDVGNWNTSKVTNMYRMFNGCRSLETLDVSNWNTSKVLFMGEMFCGCSNIHTLNIVNWNTKKVVYMYGMFSGCNSIITLDVSFWNTGSVKNMCDMFSDCSELTMLDVRNWNTSKVTNMASMFFGCSSLRILDVSQWNITNLTEKEEMFTGTRWESNPPI